jgi:hypothetical protein
MNFRLNKNTPQYQPNPYDEIIPGLFIGNEIAPNLYGDRFQMIVNCTPDVKIPASCRNSIRLSINDHPSESDHLYNLLLETQTLERIHLALQNKQPVLVHCHAGVQRSCTVVACYLIKFYHITPSAVIHYIRSKRPVAFYRGPNFSKTIDKVYTKVSQHAIL